MPPFGLYPMGRHHLYGGHGGARRSFNSNDFVPGPRQPVEVDSTAQGLPSKDETMIQNSAKRNEDKKGKKRSRSKERRLGEGAADDRHATADTSQSKEKRKTRKEEARIAQETPTQGSGHHKKKRKRESEGLTETPTAARVVNSSFEVGGDIAQNVEASLHGLATSIPGSFETPQRPEKVRKKKKPSRKSGNPQVIDQRKSDVVQTPGSDKPKIEKHKQGKNTDRSQPDNEVPLSTKTPRKTPVPPPKLLYMKSRMDTQTGHEEHKPMPKRTPVPPPQLSHAKDKSTDPTRLKSTTGPKKTPVPIPRLSQTASNNAVLVPETPPTTHSQPVSNATTERKPSRKEKVTVCVSTPTSAGDDQIPKSAPPAVGNTSVPAVPNALTDANLSNHMKPSTQSQPRSRSRGAVSTVTSFPESASTRSIMDAFVRVGKPYSRSGAEVDPFVASGNKAKDHRHRETHEEASMNEFNERFLEVQKAVNFSEELSYMEEFFAWGMSNAHKELPCLGNVTGCTTKREEILRLSKEEHVTILGHLDPDGVDLNTLRHAATRSHMAEEFLMLSLRARVPVPIGRLEGTWTLYCPRYAEKHFDRYGYGQRTLTISSIAGFEHKNSYTARLNIPPRSMSYSMLAFTTPPHASFRTTTIRTAAEGYTMDIVFLGNGYLQLRADLKLLLKGKATEESEGNAHMEFIGVHEKALVWFEEKNELEEVGKKLFAKYDGATED